MARRFEELKGIVKAEETVIVTDMNGRRIKGALTAVDEDWLSLAADGRTQTFARSEVTTVRDPRQHLPAGPTASRRSKGSERSLARRTGRFPHLAHPGSRVKGVFNPSVASARRHSRRTKETAPLSPRWQSKQPNATTSPDTAFELSRRRQIPPFAAVYTREPSGVRQRSVGGDPLRKKCSDRVRR
jgi:hypothetical protein